MVVRSGRTELTISPDLVGFKEITGGAVQARVQGTKGNLKNKGKEMGEQAAGYCTIDPPGMSSDGRDLVSSRILRWSNRATKVVLPTPLDKVQLISRGFRKGWNAGAYDKGRDERCAGGLIVVKRATGEIQVHLEYPSWNQIDCDTGNPGSIRYSNGIIVAESQRQCSPKREKTVPHKLGGHGSVLPIFISSLELENEWALH
ncbi:hypothetical protein K438DRAFT_1782432 [Mycena galopus ATCC 62051]|nr:hypothetical protein K438DRAFT_1782432 [Mycena galopus ATCC 62051]